MSEISTSPDVAPGISRWRTFWGKDSKANTLWSKIANKAQPTEEFQRKMAKTVTAEERQIVETADADSLDRQIKEAIGHRDEHAQNQQTIKKVGKATVAFANNFSSFLQAYSGIVEIMQGADQQYGGVAYSALSLLLIVGVNKQRKEEHIDTAFLVLQREFSRAKMLQEIHCSDAMKTYIAEAYELGVEFAREVTLYYSRPSYRRVLEAVTKPPQLGIDSKISQITKAITEIEKERATLDSQRLFQVQRRVEDVKNAVDGVRDDVEGVRDDVEAAHIQTERMHLTLLKEKLLPGDNRDPTDVLAQYSSEVTAAFKNIQRLRTFNNDHFMQEKSYRAWDGSRVSCMMLLHGRTAMTKTNYSWLSPAIFQLIAQYHARNHLVIFHFCQDQPFMEKDAPAHTVLSSLISQLLDAMLDARVRILRDETRYHELKRKFSDPTWRATSPEVPFAVLRELLDLFPDVHILLDRVDRIRGDAYRFMNSLVSLIKTSKSRVKFFLVSSSNGFDRVGGKFPEELQESIEDDLGSDRFWTLGWNQ